MGWRDGERWTHLLLVIAIGLLATFVVAAIRPVPEDAAYAGSSGCAECHADVAAEWNRSLHVEMMRPANDDAIVVADFSTDDPHRGFTRSDAVWAIGGKWEQQFMGEEAGGETLLPGVWLKATGRWDFKGWDGWELPVPRKRCHGCHTVGLDPETGSFVEPNIGCESCHGPASWHTRTRGLGRVHSSVDADVCGQCHTRGTSPDGGYHFPVGYRPGRELAAHFVPSEPSPGNNSSNWWGNGHPRRRHQEHWAWSQGGHADSLRSLREGYDGRFGPVTDDCLSCHAADSILASGREPSVDEARFGITCAVCHNVHGSLDEVRIGCGECHGSGAFHHEPDRNADHVPCPPEADVSCVSCHMPKTATIGGAYRLHSHRAGIIEPADAARWNGPTSCANGGCHAAADPDALQEAFDDFYRRPAARGVETARVPDGESVTASFGGSR